MLWYQFLLALALGIGLTLVKDSVGWLAGHERMFQAAQVVEAVEEDVLIAEPFDQLMSLRLKTRWLKTNKKANGMDDQIFCCHLDKSLFRLFGVLSDSLTITVELIVAKSLG